MSDKHYHRLSAKEKRIYAKARLERKTIERVKTVTEKLDEKTEAALRANREAAQT